MFDLKRLMDISQSFVLYVVFAMGICIAGNFLANFDWIWSGFRDFIGKLVLGPGHALLILGFFAAALAGDGLPSKVRIASLIGGTLVILKVLGGGIFRLL